MKKEYEMYKGHLGFMNYVGIHKTEDIKDMDHKVSTGEIDYYCLVTRQNESIEEE